MRRANRNPVVNEVYTRRYYLAKELKAVVGMELNEVRYMYRLLTGENLNKSRGLARIPVSYIEMIQQAQALKKEGVPIHTIRKLILK